MLRLTRWLSSLKHLLRAWIFEFYPHKSKWWKQKTNCNNLSSDVYTCSIACMYPYTQTHIYIQTHIQNKFNKIIINIIRPHEQLYSLIHCCIPNDTFVYRILISALHTDWSANIKIKKQEKFQYFCIYIIPRIRNYTFQ